jgi:subfamily B ATP-binding cassette protein MsbA
MHGSLLQHPVTKLLKPTLRYGVFSIVLMLATVLLQLPLPLLSAWIIDHVFQQHEFQRLGPAVGVMFATGCLLLAARFGQAYLSVVFGERAKARCVNGLMSKALNMSTPTFRRRAPGYLLARLRDDVGAIDALLNTVIVAVGDGCTVLVVAVFMFTLNTGMAAIAILSLPLYVLSLAIFNRRLRDQIWRSSEREALLTQEMQEALLSHDLIKTFGAEQFHQERFSNSLSALVSARIRAAIISNWAQSVAGFFTVLLPAGLIWYGAYEFAHEHLTLGGFFAFNTYLAFLMGSAAGLMSINFPFQAFRVAIGRITQILTEKDEIIPVSDPVEIAYPQGTIEFRDVSFGYNRELPVLHNISLTVNAGEQLAVVGHSGAGKTTMVFLLSRLYEPQAGHIFLDGVDLARIEPAQFRRLVAVVPQETLLISGSIAENICYNLEANDEEIRNAAVLANADEFISALPQGYETVIGEEGFNLSCGQRQRIAIARALLRKPKVLILDEASSALDSGSEQLIQQTIQQLRRTVTIITIAHRLHTVKSAEEIVFLEHGHLVARGSHEWLYRNCKNYAALCDLQFTSAQAEDESFASPKAAAAMVYTEHA